MKLELIEQIRNGKALHYDIDNVGLLRQVLQKCAPKDRSIKTILGLSKYYRIEFNEYVIVNSIPKASIKLSSFIDTPKMISVEAVKEWCKAQHNETHDGDRLIWYSSLLTFLNTHTNVK